MAEKFTIDSEIDAYGAFWEPNTPDEKFTGRLSRDENDILLITSPELKPIVAFDRLLAYDEKTINVLYGYTTRGICTLFWLQSLQSDGLNDLSQKLSIEFRRFRISLCIFGLHIPDPASALLTSACFIYSSLEYWFRTPPEQEMTRTSITVKYRYDTPAIFDLCSRAIKSRVRFDIRPELHHGASGEVQSTNEPRLTVEPNEPQSVEWFAALAYRFENFFSLILGTSVNLRALTVFENDNQGWVLRQVRHKEQKPDPVIWLRGDISHFVAPILNWLSSPEEFLPFENLVYGTIRNSSLFVETEFLSLAQALEAFHRLTDSTTVIDSQSFKEIRGSIETHIDAVCASSPIAPRLKESINHANEPTFQKRIEGLLARIPEKHRDQLLGSPEKFERTLRQTRNYLTHPGIDQRGSVPKSSMHCYVCWCWCT
jgi:hypothetical protein